MRKESLYHIDSMRIASVDNEGFFFEFGFYPVFYFAICIIEFQFFVSLLQHEQEVSCWTVLHAIDVVLMHRIIRRFTQCIPLQFS